MAALAEDGILPVLLGGHAADVPDRYDQASQAELPAAEMPVRALHGAADDAVRPDYGRAYTRAAVAKGGDVRFIAVPDTNHFDVIDPGGRTWSLARDFVDDWLH